MALCFGANAKQAGQETWIDIGATVTEIGPGVVAAIRRGEVLGKVNFSKPLAKTQTPSVNPVSASGKGATYRVTQAPVNPDKLVSPTANPGTAQSRVNLARVTDDNGNARGWDYAIGRHGKNATTGSNKSKFSIEDDQVRTLLQDRDVVQSPVYNIRHPNGTVETNKFGRQVDVEGTIGVDQNGNNVSTVTIITNRRGELINAFPGLLD